MKRRGAIALLLLMAISATALAEEPSGRLKRIKDTGILVVSHGETGIPFSYVDKSGPVGFGVDISKRIAAAIKAHLGLQEMRIRWNPVTLSTRFPMIVTNTVDLECAGTTNTRERQKMVAFSNTFYIADEGIVTRRDSGIKDYPDLAGKRVAVVRGTTTERSLIARSAAQKLDVAFVSERTNRRATAALVEGRADAYVEATPIAAGQLLALSDSSALHIVGSGGYKEAFGCMLPRGDAPFKKVVDDALAAMMTSGEMERLYNKWFMSPVPPYGRKVNLPLNEDNRRLYSAPNDTAFE